MKVKNIYDAGELENRQIYEHTIHTSAPNTCEQDPLKSVTPVDLYTRVTRQRKKNMCWSL